MLTMRRIYIFWSIFVAAAMFRLVTSFLLHAPEIGPCIKQKVSGEGIIAVEPERKESGQVFIISTKTLDLFATSSSEQVACGADIAIRIKTKLYPRFEYGGAVRFVGKLSEPFNFSSDSGRTFDYKGYLAKDDVFHEIKSAEVEAIDQQTNEATAFSVFSWISTQLFNLKRGFVGNLEKVLGEPHSALAAGLVVGEKSALGKYLLNDFRVVGLIHIIVLSGYNITIVADALRKMLSFLPRVWGIMIGGIGIMLFGILVGGGATVVRSCFMAGVALTADVIRRDYSVTRALMFAGLLMLIQNPLILLHDPSFQLSFMATLGLILLASPIESKIQFIPEKFGMRGIVASTLATQIFVSPYILYMMGTLSIIGIIVNILVLPFVPATMLVVFAAGATGFIFQPLSLVFGWIAHLLLSYELFMVETFAKVPFAALEVPVFSGWFVVGFYGLFFLVYGTIRYGLRLKQSSSHNA
jgi:competence protein ComEC